MDIYPQPDLSNYDVVAHLLISPLRSKSRMRIVWGRVVKGLDYLMLRPGELTPISQTAQAGEFIDIPAHPVPLTRSEFAAVRPTEPAASLSTPEKYSY